MPMGASICVPSHKAILDILFHPFIHSSIYSIKLLSHALIHMASNPLFVHPRACPTGREATFPQSLNVEICGLGSQTTFVSVTRGTSSAWLGTAQRLL